MDITPDARDRLAAEMEARRLDLGLSWREVATRAGLSYEMVMKLRTRATSARPLTLRKADTGFGWEPGSSERILNGGEPVPVAETPADGELRPLDAFERAVTDSELSAAEKAAAIRDHREQIARQLEELGIGERPYVPPIVRDGIRRLARGGGADDGHEERARRA